MHNQSLEKLRFGDQLRAYIEIHTPVYVVRKAFDDYKRNLKLFGKLYEWKLILVNMGDSHDCNVEFRAKHWFQNIDFGRDAIFAQNTLIDCA